MSEFRVVDNTKKVLNEFQKKVEMACRAVGSTAEKYAKGECPVDTGRLRNSITYTTAGFKGTDSYKDKQGTQYSGGSAYGGVHGRSIYIGTNVEYARYVEFGDKATHKTGKAHFLRDAAANHGAEYKDIFTKALKE